MLAPEKSHRIVSEKYWEAGRGRENVRDNIYQQENLAANSSNKSIMFEFL
jgi:hypothetical protein